MPTPLKAEKHLEREFLEIRCRLLDIASALDRIDGAEAAAALRDHTRLQWIREAAHALVDGQPDRAERIQRIFSLAYEENWR